MVDPSQSHARSTGGPPPAAEPAHRHRRLQQPVGRRGASLFTTPEQAEALRPVHADQAGAAQDLPPIYLDCGTEDRLITGALELAGYRAEENIPFNYMQMPGAHNAGYWIEAIGHIMSVQYEVMQHALGQGPFGRVRRSTN